MNKKLFSVLVILMSLSLIGIIFVQAYYINYSLETKEDQFAFNVKKVLSYASSVEKLGLVDGYTWNEEYENYNP